MEGKLSRSMESLSFCFSEIDRNKRGYFYGWELLDYLLNSAQLQ